MAPHFPRGLWLKGWVDSQRFEDLREIIQEYALFCKFCLECQCILLLNPDFKAIRNTDFASIICPPATKPDRLFSQFYTKSMNEYY